MKRIVLFLFALCLVVMLFTKNAKASSQAIVVNHFDAFDIPYDPHSGKDLNFTLPIPSVFNAPSDLTATVLTTSEGPYSDRPTGFIPKTNINVPFQSLELNYSGSNFSVFDPTWMNSGITVIVHWLERSTSKTYVVQTNIDFIFSYTIQYYDNYPENNQSITVDVPKNVIPALIEPAPRPGYQFTGWYLEPEAITKYVLLPVPLTQDVTLYAGWKKLNLDTNMPTVDPVIPSDPDTNMPTVDPVIPSDPDTNMPTVDPIKTNDLKTPNNTPPSESQNVSNTSSSPVEQKIMLNYLRLEV